MYYNRYREIRRELQTDSIIVVETYRSGHNGAHSKCVCPSLGTRVRIPPSPLFVNFPFLKDIHMTGTKRLDYLDMVKFVGIFFVVLGHIEYISTPLRVWISSFHMPLFFIVSGLLMAIKNEPARDFKESVKKKFRGIIIPYLWFSLSYFIIDIGNLKLNIIDMPTFIDDTISHVNFYGMSVLWFLPCIFLADIGFLFLKHRLEDKQVVIFLLVLAVAAYFIESGLKGIFDGTTATLLVKSIINFFRVFLRAMIAMSLVGYAYYLYFLLLKLIPEFNSELDKKTKIILFITGAVMIAGGVVVSVINDAIDMHFIILRNVPLFYLGAFLGSFGIIFVCRSIPSVKLCTYFGRNSIIVMACHINYYILYAGLRIAMKIIQYVSHAKHYIMLAITMIVVFALSVIVIEGINRLFPFVLGKPFKWPFGSKSEKA